MSYWNCSSSYRVTDLSTLNESLVTGNSSSAVLLRDTLTTAVAKNVIVVALCISINYINGTLVHTFFKHEVPCRPYPWRVKTAIGHWGVCMVKTSWGRLKTPWIETRNFFLETNTLVASFHNMIAFGLYLYYLNCYVQITALAKEWYNLGRSLLEFWYEPFFGSALFLYSIWALELYMRRRGINIRYVLFLSIFRL